MGRGLKSFVFSATLTAAAAVGGTMGSESKPLEDAGPKRGGSNDDLPVRRVRLAVDRLIDFRSVAGWPSVSAAAGAGAAVSCAPLIGRTGFVRACTIVAPSSSRNIQRNFSSPFFFLLAISLLPTQCV